MTNLEAEIEKIFIEVDIPRDFGDGTKIHRYKFPLTSTAREAILELIKKEKIAELNRIPRLQSSLAPQPTLQTVFILNRIKELEG